MGWSRSNPITTVTLRWNDPSTSALRSSRESSLAPSARPAGASWLGLSQPPWDVSYSPPQDDRRPPGAPTSTQLRQSAGLTATATIEALFIQCRSTTDLTTRDPKNLERPRACRPPHTHRPTTDQR